MSWFWRGAQSAVFYYLSCTPWFSYLHERKREKERNQARAAKASEDIEAGVYAHPLPADTNPYWNEEIMQGPEWKRGRVSKEKTKSESTKRLNTGGPESSAGDGSTLTFPSLDVEEDDVLDEGWNKRIYQRPDEHLFGSDDMTCVPYSALSSRAANKPLVSGDGAYYNARTPAVSELHPPVISNRPKHPSQAQWMTQPPPPAKIMEGKERADRSRSVSNASYGSTRGTGGAMAGRDASLRRRAGTARQQESLPIDMDPSPPEDDGMKTGQSGNGVVRFTNDSRNVDSIQQNKTRTLQPSQDSCHQNDQTQQRHDASDQSQFSLANLSDDQSLAALKTLAPVYTKESISSSAIPLAVQNSYSRVGVHVPG